jgi:hypothetical protein
VKYLPLGKGGKQYVQTLYKLGDACGIGERFAIVGNRPSHSWRNSQFSTHSSDC